VPIKVVSIGLGPIGAGVVKQLATRKGFRLVGAVDIDPNKVGRDAGDVCGVGRKLRVAVTADIGKTLKAVKPDVAVLCTSSSIKKVVPEFEAVLKHKVPIVSTTEELSYPVKSHAAAAKRIDALARRARVAVLGTGVNPGFAMDALPIALTGVCESVTAIEVDRVQDARIRRLPFQKKIGAGLTTDEFQARVRDGSVRHVGLAESITMIADAMGWTLDRVTDEIAPKIAEARVSSEFLTVEPGFVCGIVQDGVGYRKGEPLIKLHMEAYLGAPESFDATRVTGTPNLSMKVAGGIHGDVATASITVNSIPKVLSASPGLRTMRDMVLPSFYGGRS
jgi:4-hydroxy-tetrahydrodipicolinate reductase